MGANLVSTWITKLEVHVEEITNLVKNSYKTILDDKNRKFAVVNDAKFVELAAAA